MSNSPDNSGTEQTEFRTDQIQAVYALGAENHFWCLARNRVLVRQLQRLPDFDQAMPIFDVGCGRGFTIAHLVRHGYNCFGSDLSDYSPPHSDAAGRTFYNTDLDRLPERVRLETRLILILDVLEHLPAPEVLLQSLRRIFPRAQWLVVTVPARSELWTNYDEYYGHYRRYSSRSLVHLLESAGFRMRSWRYFFHGLYVPALLAKLLGGGRSTVVGVKKKSLAHEWIAGWLYAEQIVVPGFVVGSSLIAVCALENGR